MSVGVFNAEAQRRRGSRRASGARDSSEPSRAQASAEQFDDSMYGRSHGVTKLSSLRIEE